MSKRKSLVCDKIINFEENTLPVFFVVLVVFFCVCWLVGRLVAIIHDDNTPTRQNDAEIQRNSRGSIRGREIATCAAH